MKNQQRKKCIINRNNGTFYITMPNGRICCCIRSNGSPIYSGKNELTKNIEESTIFLSQESSVNMRADAVKVILVNPRGINNIDMSLEAGSTYMFDSLSLKRDRK